jgi:hypothetical protein
MTLKQLIKIEDKAKEVWVISPSLHYDLQNNDFSELVSVNLGEKTKYRYIVPVSPDVHKNIELYRKKYGLSEEEVSKQFLILPENDFTPFLMEIAIYDAHHDCIACAAPGLEDDNEVIRFDKTTSAIMAKQFKSVWKKYKREKL